MNTWHVFESALNKNECDQIIKLGEDLSFEKGSAGGSINKLRETDISWIHNSELQNRLFEYVQTANATTWAYDIENYCSRGMQYTVYEGHLESYYKPHVDVYLTDDHPYQRKLSITLQLSDPDEYEGGDFSFTEIIDKPDTDSLKKKGTILVFPSFMKHEVKPVTRGTRRSLVAWFEGPRWR